jgi:hypothetical protein
MLFQLGLTGWLNGLTALGVVVINTINGIYVFYKSRRLQAKLLTYASLMIFFIGLLWLGPTVDFVIILMTGTNIDPYWIYPLLSYMWTAPGILFAMYIGSELLMPKKKWIMVSIFIVLSIIFEIFLFLTPETSFTYPDPLPMGSDIIDTSFVYGGIPFIIIAIYIVSIILVNGIGFLRKAFQATGIVRKKFLYLASGFILFGLVAIFDALIPPGLLLPIVRTGIIISAVLLYLGLKT